MAYIPSSDSVVAFQSKPSSLLVGASIIGVTPVNVVNTPIFAPSSVYVINPVSTLSISTTSAPSSVQLLAGNAAIGSVTTLQGTNPWQVNVPTPSYISYQVAGSIMAVSGSFSATPQSSIIAIQLAGSIMAVSATVNTGNSSVQLLGGVATIGSVAVLQGTSPWLMNVPTPSYIAYQLAGSVMAVAATVNTGNSSVQLLGGVAMIGSIISMQGGTWGASVTGTMSVLGTVPVTQATTPWVINMPSPSVIIMQQAGSILAVSATVNTGNSSVQLLNGIAVIGSVATLQGTNPWQVNVVNPNSSVMLTASTNHSVIAVLSNSSVAVLQGTTPWTVGTTSVQLISTSASIIANQTFGYSSVMLMASTNSSVAVLASQNTNPWVIGSIVGTFGEDSAHTTADKGIFVMGVRNDAISSMTSAESDYSPHAVDAIGRTIVKPFAGEQACIISAISSVNSGSVTLLQASVIGSRSYITDFWAVNTGSVAQLITIQGGDTSLIAYTIAPAGGGSNSPGIAIPLRTTLSQDLAWKTTGTSSTVYLTVKGYQAP